VKKLFLISAILLCSVNILQAGFVPISPQQFNDATFRLFDNSDPTKRLAFELASLTTDTTRTFTAPDTDGTILLDCSIDTFAELDALVADQSLVHTGIDDDVPDSGDLGIIDTEGKFESELFALITPGEIDTFAELDAIVADKSLVHNPLTSALYLADGTAALPSQSFESDTDTGFYHPGGNQIGVSCGGSLSFKFSVSGLVVQDTRRVGAENLYLTFYDGMNYAALVGGDFKLYEDIIIGDGKYIGSASDPDSIQIEGDGDVVLTQDLSAVGDVIGDEAIFGGATSTTRAWDVSAGCVAFYKMDDALATTNVVDEQGTNDGTAARNTEDFDTATAKLGTALHFNGSSDKVTVGTDASLNVGEITMEAWIKVDDAAPASSNFILNRAMTSGGTYTLLLAFSNDKWAATVRLDGSESTNRVVYSNDVATTDWTHIVGTYDGDKLKIYINGVLQDDIDDTDGAIDTDNGGNLVIGAHSGGASGFFDGIIDNLRIFNYAISAGEVTALYNSASGTESLSGTVAVAGSLVATSNLLPDFIGSDKGNLLIGNDFEVQGKIFVESDAYIGGDVRYSGTLNGITGIDDFIEFDDGGSNSHEVTIRDGLITEWYISTARDERLMKDITKLSSALDKLSQIRPVSYKWNEKGLQQFRHSKPIDPNTGDYEGIEKRIGTYYGFVAQDIQKVYPELTSEKNGYIKHSRNDLIPVLVKSIQELKAKVEILEAKIEEKTPVSPQ